MFIEKFTAYIKDSLTKKSFKIVIDEDYPHSAHKKLYEKLNNFQEISKLVDYSGNVVFDIKSGFINI